MKTETKRFLSIHLGTVVTALQIACLALFDFRDRTYNYKKNSTFRSFMYITWFHSQMRNRWFFTLPAFSRSTFLCRPLSAKELITEKRTKTIDTQTQLECVVLQEYVCSMHWSQRTLFPTYCMQDTSICFYENQLFHTEKRRFSWFHTF
jgi:hypothetical protein